MTELLSLAERYGAWLVIAIYFVYKVLPVVIEKGWPEWMELRKSEKKAQVERERAERAELAPIYERFIAQNGEMIKFIANAASAMNDITRSLDANTQALYKVLEAVKQGPACPLPDCPFMNKAGSGGGGP